ncbi:Pyridoxal 5'-phosphate synthase subunit PdxT [Koleobacter methoxysyntrophicus]|uniref:Pyridoxal 5'-phosphate synthase subunit PdxT n=2 Tax=Koleobacter methoxysyntrophicus TaxID=2751313 RepID=A0A8A0RH98_9FIRM|nr:pyridoxal 5'-phosphate synthase glutaminase subunit PdxT [Koleobacter methoxysyntrophicus]QSQ07851.1 Pyridoxal 5'-phosphate synthase subunit PdxT [Koleobacter methoxysyntrophicus]
MDWKLIDWTAKNAWLIEGGKMKKVGVLALQGSVEEHISILKKIEGIEPIKVKTREELMEVDRLIIPGGESTTMGKLLRDFNLLNPLVDRIKDGMPVWGTCAGMILLAKKIEGSPEGHLMVMDIQVRRNAYGRQIYSFMIRKVIPEFSNEKIPLIFIRAPYITEIGKNVTPLLELDGHILAAKQENMLATSFHPELTNNTVVHDYFCNKM